MRFTQLERIITHNLGDGVIPILEWSKIHVGACEVIFLQMQPHLFTNLKLVRDPMLVMLLLIIGIGLLQYIMNLFLEVMDPFD
jgi:hypothetical protein